MESESSLHKVKRIASASWRFLKATSLATADGIITLSLMRKGTRPKPGTRTAWPKGLREQLHREQRGLCIYSRDKLSLSVVGATHIDHIIPVNQAGLTIGKTCNCFVQDVTSENPTAATLSFVTATAACFLRSAAGCQPAPSSSLNFGLLPGPVQTPTPTRTLRRGSI